MGWFDDHIWNTASNTPDSAEENVAPKCPDERRPSGLHECERCHCLIPPIKRRWCSVCSEIVRSEERNGHDER